MLRAATLGVFDFAQFDPWDAWHWKRLRLVLDEISRRNNQEALLAQQTHWVALMSNPRLEEESWEGIKMAAQDTLTQILQGYYPWREKEIGEAGAKTSRDRAVDQFREQYGRPGEPRYDQMVAELGAYFAKGKLSQREKELERKKRREQQPLATAG